MGIAAQRTMHAETIPYAFTVRKIILTVTMGGPNMTVHTAQ